MGYYSHRIPGMFLALSWAFVLGVLAIVGGYLGKASLHPTKFVQAPYCDGGSCWLCKSYPDEGRGIRR